MNSTAIVTLTTGNYWKGTTALFQSLQTHNILDGIDLVTLSNEDYLFPIGCKIPITEDYTWVKTVKGQFSHTANKLFALTLDYDRIILIDSDIICVKDCQFLWSDHINSLPFYAVRDTATTRYYPQEINRLKLEKDLLFNAGVMVYNKTQLPNLHRDLLQAIHCGDCQSYDGGDQGYLNKFFQLTNQEVGYLPPGYNYLTDRYMPRIPEPHRHLIHFAGKQKPWDLNYNKDLGPCNQYKSSWKKSFQSV